MLPDSSPVSKCIPMGKPNMYLNPVDRERERQREAYVRDLTRLAREHYERENVEQLMLYLQNQDYPRVEYKEDEEK